MRQYSGRRCCPSRGLLIILVPVVCLTAAFTSLAQSPLRPAVRPVDTVLTVEALTQLTTFWMAFQEEADSIRRPAPQTLGTPFPLVMIDTVYSGWRINRTELIQNVTALAVRYPSVAVDLARAGLTGTRYHTLFATLLNSCRTFNGMLWGNPVTPTPLEATNIAFLQTHRKELHALLTSAGVRDSGDNAFLDGVTGRQRLGVGDCAHMARNRPTPTNSVILDDFSR